MFRPYARTLFTLAALISLPAVAFALPPSPPLCTVPAGIVLVGETGGVPDPHGAFTVVVRDVTGAPVPGAVVTIEFFDTPEMSVGVPQNHPGTTLVACAPVPRVQHTADAAGVATFVVTGAVTAHGVATGCRAHVFASDGGPPVLLTDIGVAAYDLDGHLGVTTNDVYLWLCDFGAGQNPCYSDFDFTGGVGASDLSKMVAVLFGHQSLETPALCAPPGGPPQAIATTTGGLQLQIADCTDGGSPNFTPSFCTGPTSRYTEFVGSLNASDAMISSGIANYTGVEAIVRVVDFNGTFATPLDPFWRFDAPLGCHNAGFFPVGADGSNCLASSPAYGECGSPGFGGAGRFAIAPEPGALNTTLLQLYSVAHGDVQDNAIPADNSYTPLFAFRINHNLSCAGCGDNLAFILESVRLTSLADAAMGCGSCPMSPTSAVTPAELLGPGGAHTIVDVTGDGDDPRIVFTAGAVVDAPIVPGGRVLALSDPVPNPSSGFTRVELSLPEASDVEAAVVDLAGRRIATLQRATRLSAGPHLLLWDGATRAGRAPAGRYFIVARVGERTLVKPLSLRR